MWAIALVGNIFSLISGILLLAKNLANINIMFIGIDIIVLNVIVLVIGLLLIKKNKGSGWM